MKIFQLFLYKENNFDIILDEMLSQYSQPLWMAQTSKLVCILHTPPLLLDSCSLVTTYYTFYEFIII